MKTNRFVYIMLLLCGINCSLPAQLSIETCKQKACANYPQIKRYELIERSNGYNLANAGKGYLPQVSLQAKASYQTQVTEIQASLPGIDIQTPNKDQYGATLELTQTIWDGGAIRSQKDMIQTATNVEKQQLTVDLYEINERVNQLFFGILLQDAWLEQNRLLQDELTRNYDVIAESVANGVANQTDLDIIRIEQLNTKQAEVQLEFSRKAYVEMLQILIGEPIPDSIILQKPVIDEIVILNKNRRPELSLFDARTNNLDARQDAIKAGLMPTIGLFATGGYGNPALNMLKPEFSAYFIGGIRLSWNIGRLYTYKNEKRLIDVNKRVVGTQRETFLFNTNLESVRQLNEINKQRQLLTFGDEKISLREQVKKATEIKVTNGMATVTDLMDEITLTDLAKQEKVQHEIELLLFMYQLKHTINDEL